MFFGYPLGATHNDDNQAAQGYLMNELADGNLLIGNVRYQTGYALIMSPVFAWTRDLDQFGERIFLLVQITLCSLIPFLVYDIFRRRLSARAALAVALVTLLDPFALQWAHFRLPGWLIALATVFALWLAARAWTAPAKTRFAYIAMAGVALGMMTIARINFAPLVAVFGISLLFWRHIPLRQRLALCALVAAISAGLLGSYYVLIHIPSTNTFHLSCISGQNLISSAMQSANRMYTHNGEASAQYARLLRLPPTRDTSVVIIPYRLWRKPDYWVSDAQHEAYLAQPFGEPKGYIHTTFPLELYWHLGPCETDALMHRVAIETIVADPANLLRRTLAEWFYMLVQHPGGVFFPLQYLEEPGEISCEDEAVLGFCRASSALFNGHRIWRPAVAVYSFLFPLLNAAKLLTPIAIVAACWRRDWLLVTVATLLVVGLGLIAATSLPEPRYFAMLAPLYSILIGWLFVQSYGWMQARRARARSKNRSRHNLP